MTYLLLHLIMHLLLFLSPDYLSHINSLGFLFIFCFSLNARNVRLYYPYWQYRPTFLYFDLLDFSTIRIDSTTTFLYFDLYLNTAYKHACRFSLILLKLCCYLRQEVIFSPLFGLSVARISSKVLDRVFRC